MLFHSLEFAIFFIIVFSLYLLLPFRLQNRMLFFASYVFYGWWDWRFLSLVLLSTIVDYFCAIGIEDRPRHARHFIHFSVIFNLTLLGIFKYYDFFALSFQKMFASLGVSVDPFLLNVALPVGISFYTFQTMSYTLDVYRGKLKAARDFLDFGLYVSYFPQLVAGPIERGTNLLPQVLSPRTVSWERFKKGAFLFVWGIFLKVFIADNLAKVVDMVYSAPPPYEGALVLLATYAFSFQIYGDFAGYSFMAIGLGHAMGFTLMENFRRPYFSKNIGEFWRRWHISLSSWFRDYVFSPWYIHISNWNRVKNLPLKQRHGIAFFLTLFITEWLLGMWHGAGWNFGMFGIYHAFMIWAYYYLKPWWDRMPDWLQILLTYHVACGGWLVFRAADLDQAMAMFGALFFNFHWLAELDVWGLSRQLLGLVSILVVVQFFQDRQRDTYVPLSWPVETKVFFFSLIVLLSALSGNFGARAFIYFQF